MTSVNSAASASPPAPAGRPHRLGRISSGTATAVAAHTALRDGVTSVLGDPPRPDPITAADVAAAAQTGDRLARTIPINAAEALGLQLANLVRIVGLEATAVGGGVTLAGATFWDPLRPAIEASLQQQDAIPVPRRSPAELGGDVGLYGAAWSLIEDPGSGRTGVM